MPRKAAGEKSVRLNAALHLRSSAAVLNYVQPIFDSEYLILRERKRVILDITENFRIDKCEWKREALVNLTANSGGDITTVRDVMRMRCARDITSQWTFES